MTVLIALVAAVAGNAQTTTFAQFLQQNGTNDFNFVNNSGASGTLAQTGGGVPVDFKYLSIANLDPSLAGFQSAHLFISTNTTVAATAGGALAQPLNGTVTIQIIRDVATAPGVGTGTRRNLLTAVFTPASSMPALTGTAGGNSATLSATTPDHNVTFTSDFLSFAATTQRNLGLSFSSVTDYTIGSGGFLNSFTAAATGTFASNPPPVYKIPTSAAVGVSGSVVLPTGRRVARATVVLTEADGTTHVTKTNAAGFFSFDGIEVGQAVTISTNVKRYQSDPVVVSLFDQITDLSITLK